MTPRSPDLKHLVLMGGGHAQVAVLKSLAMSPVDGLRVTLVSRDILTPYSGMLPGYLEGAYSAEDISIDLSHLARVCGARFIHGEVTAITPEARTITISGRPPMGYDLLSINTGSAPDVSAIPGASDHAVPVKPISTLLSRIAPLFDDDTPPQRIAIIGGGAAGVEVALALHHRLTELDGQNIRPENIRFELIHRGERIMPEFPAAAARHLMAELSRKGIAVHCGQAAERITSSGVSLADGQNIPADLTLMVTAGVAPEVITASGLALDDRGYIAVTPTLQSVSHPDVFAAGDVATVMAAPRPKAGVFAVRAGPVLTDNLRRAVLSAPLTSWRPQRHYLALIGVGGGRAMPIRGGLTLPPSRWAWRLKEAIDRKFIAKFSDLPEMAAPLPSPLARRMEEDLAKGTTKAKDPALLAMRCLGCGAKTGWSDLDAAIRGAEAFLIDQGHDLPRRLDTAGDSARFPAPDGELVQSVDAISALVDDPFLLGRIAALHALSDLFASHARPHSALAILTLPSALAALQKDDITQLLAGAMLALNHHGAELKGGHTSQADNMQVGFAVTGIDRGGKPYAPVDGDAVILTKPLGVGMVMAAHMKGHPLATGKLRDQALSVMATSNGPAAEVLSAQGRLPMTDVTGFGLARHAASLLAGLGTASVEISAADLPVLEGVMALARDGVESSLTSANAAAAPVTGTSSLPRALLHDPQTGGGLLAIVPKAKADQVLAEINLAASEAAGPATGDSATITANAAIIGRYRADDRAELRIS